MTENNENLQEMADDVSITASAEGNTEASAAGNAAEDTPQAVDPNEEIIKQQSKTIDALIERTEQLTDQINQLIRSGAQINDGKAEPETQTPNEMDNYVSLADLGAEIGKHDRY